MSWVIETLGFWKGFLIPSSRTSQLLKTICAAELSLGLANNQLTVRLDFELTFEAISNNQLIVRPSPKSLRSQTAPWPIEAGSNNQQIVGSTPDGPGSWTRPRTVRLSPTIRHIPETMHLGPVGDWENIWVWYRASPCLICRIKLRPAHWWYTWNWRNVMSHPKDHTSALHICHGRRHSFWDGA